MKKYIPLDALITEIWKRRTKHFNFGGSPSSEYCHEDDEILRIINTLEVKEVNEVPATVMVNKYGNRFISSWPGLKEYDNFKKGEEIKIVIPKR